MITVCREEVDHTNKCGSCSDHGMAYYHVFPERADWGFEEELMYAMTVALEEE